jgi:hypothetical protein
MALGSGHEQGELGELPVAPVGPDEGPGERASEAGGTGEGVGLRLVAAQLEGEEELAGDGDQEGRAKCRRETGWKEGEGDERGGGAGGTVAQLVVEVAAGNVPLLVGEEGGELTWGEGRERPGRDEEAIPFHGRHGERLDLPVWDDSDRGAHPGSTRCDTEGGLGEARAAPSGEESCAACLSSSSPKDVQEPIRERKDSCCNDERRK